MKINDLDNINVKWVEETNCNEDKLKDKKYQNQKKPSFTKQVNNKLAIEQVPPGVMHVVLLGQGNDLYDFTEENLPADKKDALEKFEKHFGHRRANYFNKTWEGNQLQEPESLHPFVES